MYRVVSIVVCIWTCACVPDLDIKVDDSGTDTGADTRPEDASVSDLSIDESSDGNPVDAPMGDANTTDAAPNSCMPQALPCLPDNTPRLINVTTSADLELATAGSILQIRGQRLGRFRIKPFVTLHGCDDAELVGAITFDGNAGTVEGFIVTGVVVANQTGSYVVRDNIFRGSFDRLGQLQANARDGVIGASVEMIVERNRFEDGEIGLSASTFYDTMTRQVTLTARNNYFINVQRPIRLSEGGLVGKIDATLEFNTLVNFQEGVSFFDVENLPTLRANILAGGDLGVRSDQAFVAPLNMGWDLVTPSNMAPVSGEITIIPPSFQNSTSARLSADSLAIDAAGNMGPPEDHDGCLRPRGDGVDVGAFESH